MKDKTKAELMLIAGVVHDLLEKPPGCDVEKHLKLVSNRVEKIVVEEDKMYKKINHHEQQ